MVEHKNTNKPEPARDNPKLAALPQHLQPRFDSEKERKTFLDEKEMLRRLPISRRTLFNWRMSGKIPAIVIGRRVLFCWDNVAEALGRLERGGVSL
jgi:hypothetical protein